MINYGFKRELDQKAPKWEFRALQSRVDRLVIDKERLENKITSLHNHITNLNYVIDRLFQLLIEADNLADNFIINKLINLKNELMP